MKVSIIIPAYDAERTIEATLQSAIAAGEEVVGGYEVVVVDNNSSDGTSERVAHYGSTVGVPIKLIKCVKQGASAARNFGTQHSSGEWLQYLDADDTIDRDKITRQIACSQGADWVVGAYRNLYLDGSTEDVLTHPDLWKGLAHGFRTGYTCSNLVRRNAIDRIGGWNESLPTNEDPELWFRLLKCKIPYAVDNVVRTYYYHHAGKRLSFSNPVASFERRVRMQEEIIEWLAIQLPEYYRRNRAYFIRSLIRTLRQQASYDLEAAAVNYRNYCPENFSIWQGNPDPSLPVFTRLYPYLGFRNVEALRLLLARVLPERLKARLKG